LRATLFQDRLIELDLPELRRRLARPGHPAAAVEGDHGAGPRGHALKSASVLVPIVARAPELTVLFTRRTAYLRSHSGQISFPGGRAEAHDESPESTALRETREEIGLDPGRVELLGRLSDYHTGTGYRIAPYIGVVTPPLELQPDLHEVEEVFEVPLSFLLDPRNHRRLAREYQGKMRPFFAIPYGNHYIWGATAGMLVNLYRQLAQG
jgi:8-oxo-dGTP pyrophosphatase MutT (NUDIX family)